MFYFLCVLYYYYESFIPGKNSKYGDLNLALSKFNVGISSFLLFLTFIDSPLGFKVNLLFLSGEDLLLLVRLFTLIFFNSLNDFSSSSLDVF